MLMTGTALFRHSMDLRESRVNPFRLPNCLTNNILWLRLLDKYVLEGDE